ncbi:protein SUPPRESSOR OF npr1-1, CONSTITUTIVE 1-like [Quercus lobata]|uniref:protein SUPPRESSOR OF npr1-1, CONSTITUTIVE 1-like n=1 Tax=Quercus lobata TaxID=97700 RepID=UPI00124514BA|nr:protein SUPPRESSOR OF npr1-1, CONSTITUTIVE 1-like [Quercus lobata]XP_030955397.1 protein SUPPRESSOR OF npr1-1, CONSTITUTIVE 1-like [Quercus lobata]
MDLMGMETDSSSFPSSFSSSVARWKYDVFLSFRGEHTRNTLADLLYDAFNQKGINAFKDDEKLEKGNTISPELSRAIEESRFAVVIFSKNYASSTWCLDELAKIIHCEEHMGMQILPVFYDVEPSDVRKQMGTFAQAFIEHEKRFKENIEKVKMWRDALTHVGNLAGWPLMNRPFSQVIKSIVRLIWHNLNNDAFSEVTKGLVGIYSHVVELESCLDVGSNDVRFVGIWAMGGMGKTTLAWVVYHMVSKDFEGCIFIEGVRENFEKYGCVAMQQKIIEQILMEKDLKIKDKYDGVKKIKNVLHHKRILLVLDDVDKLHSLNMLAGEHDWFGPGSRVIITTRDRHVLETHGVDEIYEVKGLNNENALQLFCLKAFKKEHVPDDYIGLSNHFLEYAGGLPLALEVLGSFLFGKNIAEWKIALERLREYPNPEVLHVLKISFDGLHYLEKEIFLYIACFFNHNMKDHVVEVLDNLGLYASIGLKELIDKSLLKIMDHNVVWMHDLVEEMGKNIVFRECPGDPGKRSRLWFYEDIDKVLRKNEGTKAVQAMDIWGGYFLEGEGATWNPDAFLKMYNLKFLRVNSIDCVPTHLPDDLRILDWTKYPSKSLPSSIQLDELVQLCLQRSKIEQLWIGIKHFQKLKFIDLTDSSNLIITPDFTGVQNLEILVLNGCEELRELHPSIGLLKKLVRLDLMCCEKLVGLPSTICCLKSLESLDLSRCSNFENLPENLGNVKGLKRLDLSGTAIKELPCSIECLPRLTSLNIHDCEDLVCLPNTTCGFKFHGALDLSTCSIFKNLPENPWIIDGLGKLDLSKTAIEELPSSIEHLIGLTSLTLRSCKNLVCLPSTICSLKLLESLDLFGCSNFDELPENLGNIKGLKRLYLSGTAIKELPLSIGCLTSLTSLNISDCKKFVHLPGTICSLKSLESLDLSGCSNFDNLPKNLGNVKGLKRLDLSGTSIKEVPSSIVLLKNLEQVLVHGLKETLFSFNSMPTSQLPSLLGVHSLTYLDLCDCNLSSIPNDIGNLSSLAHLNLCGNNFVSLPKSISQLSNLQTLNLEGCKRLQSLENVPLTVEFIIANNCTSLERLPDLQNHPFRSCPSRLLFTYLNCFKLVDNIQSGSKLLKGQIGRLPNMLEIIIPGGEIPKWFSPATFILKSTPRSKLQVLTGHTWKIQLQVPSCGCDELMGIVLCIVFVPNGSYQSNCAFEVHGFRGAVPVKSNFAIDYGKFESPTILDSGFMTNYGKVESPHLWLLYLSTHYSGSNWGETFSQIDANGTHQFEIEISSPEYEVEKVGFHLVYKQDIEDLNQTMAQCCNNSMLYEDLGDLHHDHYNSAVEGFKNKRSNDGDDGVGPSRKGYSNKKPQPERIQRLGRFMADSEDSSQREIFYFKEKTEDEVASEPHGMVIDVKEVKMTNSSGQKKFEIEEIGNKASSQLRQPEGIQVEEMQLQASSEAIMILKPSEMEPEASEQHGLFLMQGGLVLTKLPKDEDWKNAKEIYLMDNELSDLPENPSCPNLSALFLPRNYKLRTIPQPFFNFMPALQILNLSRTGIKSLPDSLIRLVSLKRLFLNNCHRLMILSPKVGDLKQLEVLDLEGANIMDLPKEIKNLTNLTCLEVSFYGFTSNGRRTMQSNAVVPCGVLSALSQLEELNIDVNPDDERWDAFVEDIVNEVCTLKRLETLKFYFPRVELLSHFLWNSLLLPNFRFTVGHHVKRILSRVPSDAEFELERWERCLKYINGEGVHRDIKKLLQHVTAFFLDRHATIKKLSDFGTKNMKQLKCCVVGECNELQVIIDAADAYGEDGISEIVSESYGAERIVLGSLEHLYIYYMKSLRSIWEGPVQQNSLFLLKSLTLSTCPQLTTIFTQGLLDNLCNLGELKVEYCHSIKSIVSCEISAEHGTSYFLPNLKKISLHCVPGLVSISNGLHIAPKLEWLSFYNCPNLKNPLIDEVSSQDLKKIKGERRWWEELEWSNGRPGYLDEIFVPIEVRDF